MSKNPKELGDFIWQIADLLRGPYRPPQYERVMLPLTVLRRFDCVLEKTKPEVLAEYKNYQRKLDSLESELNVREHHLNNLTEEDAKRLENEIKACKAGLDTKLKRITGERFYNVADLTFAKLKSDPDNIQIHLNSYKNGFSENVRKIFDYFEFEKEIEKMQEADILYLVVSKFSEVPLHPEDVDSIEMGNIFEDLIRRFNELANETAGDHFTPREVIQLMVEVLFNFDDQFLSQPGTVRELFDPTCGTGGMLAEAQKHLKEHHEESILYINGQDFNPRAYAIAASDFLIKKNEKGEIRFGDSLINDQFEDDERTGEKKRFDYFLANPPFGVDWKRQKDKIEREHEKSGYAGRFGAGLPRVNDGALLFLQHMIDKFEDVNPAEKKHGSRLAIVLNGSPLFTGGAGSGESDIRRWIIQNDWLEAVIALPEQMFYNTGIGTYIWILTNRKEKQRRGKIQLIDARERWQQMRKSLGNKRREISDADREAIVCEYGNFAESETSKIFDNEDFGYTRVTVERPLRLQFQIDVQKKSKFLDAYPHLLDDIEAIDEKFGREIYYDWNKVWQEIEAILRTNDSKWRSPEHKLFRGLFTERSEVASPVVAKREKPKNKEILELAERFGGWFSPQAEKGEFLSGLNSSLKERIKFESDSELREFENVPLKPYDDEDFGFGSGLDYEKIPLKENIDAYFRREVLPHVPEAWMDREKNKIGYEINFNRYFYKYTPPRPLEEIDAELKIAEEKIFNLLNEVTSK